MTLPDADIHARPVRTRQDNQLVPQTVPASPGLTQSASRSSRNRLQAAAVGVVAPVRRSAPAAHNARNLLPVSCQLVLDVQSEQDKNPPAGPWRFFRHGPEGFYPFPVLVLVPVPVIGLKGALKGLQFSDMIHV